MRRSWQGFANLEHVSLCNTFDVTAFVLLTVIATGIRSWETNNLDEQYIGATQSPMS